MRELLACPICEKQFQTLNSHIHFKHALTTEEFLKKYPGTKLVSDVIKNSVSKTCKKVGCGKWMKGYKFSSKRRKQYSRMNLGDSNPFFGKVHSDEARKKMSDNHADFSGNKNPLVKWLKKDPKNREKYSKRMKQIWKNGNHKEMLSRRNTANFIKSVENGNYHPYTNCEKGWFKSEKFNKEFYFCSSYEKRFLLHCESSSKITSLQTVPFMIQYIDELGKKRNYYADFLINGNLIIEIKPKSMLDFNHNRQKIKAAKKFSKNNGYKYKLLMERELKNLDGII